MGYTLSKTSLNKLQGVHPDLVKVVERAIKITTQDFSVGEGLRSIARQKELVAKGASTTMKSRHITGHAVDLFPYPLSWDWKYCYPITEAMKQAAKELNVDLKWGGDWKSFKGGPHFELSHKNYP